MMKKTKAGTMNTFLVAIRSRNSVLSATRFQSGVALTGWGAGTAAILAAFGICPRAEKAHMNCASPEFPTGLRPQIVSLIVKIPSPFQDRQLRAQNVKMGPNSDRISCHWRAGNPSYLGNVLESARLGSAIRVRYMDSSNAKATRLFNFQ